ncbi:hypothetical protein DSO57_1030136 [Entomophthora muscae]|uniref:Uncharacterized protein n=1 Tax=Entomophthora muscae TaxID=34485 RepID=A0ACC2S381_9FUNG|nr:hypothetical protein DSO57_1030136 [Entomophthora muscae]
MNQADAFKMRGLMNKDGEEACHLQDLLLHKVESSEGLFTSSQSGYLFLKSDQRYFESWTRYYFKIEDDTLLYYNRDKMSDVVGSIDLKLCAVKEANTDRRFCFLLVSNSRTYLLQAETEERVKLWISTLHKAIENALKFNRSHFRTLDCARGASKQDASSFENMRTLPGNDSCADCKADSPTWACINFGTLICIECSGIHRSFGVHISKIRSLTLDNWDSSLVEIMLALGNRHVNCIMEYQLIHAIDVDVVLNEAGVKQITANSSREDKLNWITAKYVTRLFCPPQIQDAQEASLRLNGALETTDYPLMLQLILQGASLENSFCDTTILHRAVTIGDFTSLEFFLMWTSDVDLTDSRGRTPLHLAATAGNPKLVWFLLQKGADWNIRDANDKLPLDYAVDVPDVPVVMAFRYFVFLKQSNPRLTQETTFGFDKALELFAAAPE